jgi:SAM-dependent methyltransferase
MYDAVYMRSFYDSYAEREWERFERGPTNRVNFHVHRRLLEEYIKPGDRVLDVGAGPGRFTIELARLGATVHVGDLSPTQLELNREKVTEAGYESAVVAREIMDIVDLSALADGKFDAVVCFGGPLSYLFDRAGEAVDELLRVTRPGGYLLVSVMSLFGTLRLFFDGVLDLIDRHGLQAGMEDIMASGDLPGNINDGHPMHLYRSTELRNLLLQYGAEVIAMSASNFLSPGHDQALTAVMDQPEVWDAVLRAEVEACRQPGALDGGTHLIAVGRKTRYTC